MQFFGLCIFCSQDSVGDQLFNNLLVQSVLALQTSDGEPCRPCCPYLERQSQNHGYGGGNL